MLDDHFPDATDDGERGDSAYWISLKVNVSASNYANETRASEISPMAYDDYIDGSSFHMYFYNNRSSEPQAYVISCFHPDLVMNIDASSKNSASSGYYLLGRIKSLPKVSRNSSAYGYQGYMYTILANMPQLNEQESHMTFVSNDNTGTSIDGGTTQDSLNHYYSYFNWPAGAVPSENHPIPMYSFMSSSMAFSADKAGMYLFGPVDILRAVARVIVRSNNYLTDVKLLRCNTYGLAVMEDSKSPNTAIYPGNVYGTLGDQYLTIPGSNSRYAQLDPGREENAPFSAIPPTSVDQYAYNYVLYLPEYKNVGVEDADTTGLVFNLDGTPYTIAFGEYDNGKFNGKRSNINRNFSYEFIITSEQSAPKIKYSVLPWDEKVAGNITFE
jgi:hypothetical protein